MKGTVKFWDKCYDHVLRWVLNVCLLSRIFTITYSQTKASWIFLNLLLEWKLLKTRFNYLWRAGRDNHPRPLVHTQLLWLRCVLFCWLSNPQIYCWFCWQRYFWCFQKSQSGSIFQNHMGEVYWLIFHIFWILNLSQCLVLSLTFLSICVLFSPFTLSPMRLKDAYSHPSKHRDEKSKNGALSGYGPELF